MGYMYMHLSVTKFVKSTEEKNDTISGYFNIFGIFQDIWKSSTHICLKSDHLCRYKNFIVKRNWRNISFGGTLNKISHKLLPTIIVCT